MSDADLRIGSGENMQLASKTPALAPKSEGPGFAEVLGGVLRSANRDQLAAHKTAADLARGKVGTLDAILAFFGNRPADLVISDGAPDVPVLHDVDEYIQG